MLSVPSRRPHRRELPGESTKFSQISPEPRVTSTHESINFNKYNGVSVPRDGNCFYSALSYGLYESCNGAKALRSSVSRYVRDNLARFKAFLPGHTAEGYYAYHSRNGTFATQIEVFAASLALEVEIVLHLPYKTMTFAGPHAPTWGPVHMLFEPPMERGHFECLLDRGRRGALLGASTGSAGVKPSADGGQRRREVGYPTRSGASVVPPRPPSGAKVTGDGRESEESRQGAEQLFVRPGDPQPGKPARLSNESVNPEFELNPCNEISIKSFLPVANGQCDHVNFCSCCFEPEELDVWIKYDWKRCIELSNPSDCFPINLKINDVNLTGTIDNRAAFSAIKTSVFRTLGEAKMMSAKFKYKNRVIPSYGVFHAKVAIGKNVEVYHPFLVAEIENDVVLGLDFLHKFSGAYHIESDTYPFSLKDNHISKNRAIPAEDEPQEMLELADNFENLFTIWIIVDSIMLRAALDTGATKTIIKSSHCRNRNSLQKSNVQLRVANKSTLHVEGVYSPLLELSPDFSLKHPVIVAQDLPVDILIGNDLLKKLKCSVSWETETAKFILGNKTLVLQRVDRPAGQHRESMANVFLTAECNPGENSLTNQATLPRSQSVVELLCKKDCELKPECLSMVSFVKPKRNIFPATVTPISV